MRYRDANRRDRQRTFTRNADAERYRATVVADMSRGDWINPDRAKETIGQWADKLAASKLGAIKESSALRNTVTLERQIRPHWAGVSLGSVRHGDVLEWIGIMRGEGLSPSSMRKARGMLSEIFGLAERSGAHKGNPVTGTKIPMGAKREHRYLTPDEISRLAHEIANPPRRRRRHHAYRDVEELFGRAAHRGRSRHHPPMGPTLHSPTHRRRPCRRSVGARWFVDETYVKVAGRWPYVYRAVDEQGQVIDVFVSPRRNIKAARRFFTDALAAHGGPDELVTDLAQALETVIEELIPGAFHNTEQYANNRVECDHGRLKSRHRPMRSLKTDRTASVLIRGHTFIQNLRRGHYELGTDTPHQHLRVAASIRRTETAPRSTPPSVV